MQFTCPNHIGLKSFTLHETQTSCNSKHFLDEFSLVHFMFGFYFRTNFKKFNFKSNLLIAIIFEIFERSELSKNIINTLGPIAGVTSDNS
ncbi:unnamed protein product, partial [marine sediment metagenome]